MGKIDKEGNGTLTIEDIMEEILEKAQAGGVAE